MTHFSPFMNDSLSGFEDQSVNFQVSRLRWGEGGGRGETDQ